MALVGLDVTYGDAAIGPPRFHRVTNPGGRAANINRKHFSVGSESKAVYLWAKTSSDAKKGREVTDIKVCYGKNTVPDGYELLDRDLTLGRDPAVYLALKRGGKDKDPITNIFIVFDKASVPKDALEDGDDTPWTSVQPSIGGSSDEVHLWIRRKKLITKPSSLLKDSKSEEVKWDPQKLEVGDWIDQYDEYNMWRKSTVIAIYPEKNKIRVLQEGYDSQWAKTMSMDSKFIAPFGTHTKGQESYYWHNQRGDMWQITERMVEKICGKLEKYVQNGDHDGMAGSFWEGELPKFVECCLNRRFRTRKEMHLARRAIMMIVHKGFVPLILDTNVPISTNLVAQLKRVFGADRKCQYFYDKYGNREERFEDDDITDDTDTEEDGAVTPPPPGDFESKSQHNVDLDTKDGDGMFQIDDDEDEDERKEDNMDPKVLIANEIRRVLSEKFDYEDAFKGFPEMLIEGDLDNLEILSQHRDQIEDRVKELLRKKAAVSNPARHNNGYVAKRLIENINFFVHAGGFEAVLTRIGSCEDGYRIPIDEMKRLVNILYWMRHLYIDSFASTYFPRLKDVCVKRLTNLNDKELRSFDMSKIEGLLEKLSMLLPIGTRGNQDKNEQTHSEVETLFLDLAFRLLTCPIFAKQMQGAENLGLWIRRTTRRSGNDCDDSEDSDFEVDNAAMATSTTTKKGQLTSPNTNTKPSAKEMWLAEYLTKRKVAEIMLSSSVHVELMKKSGPILRFMGRCGRLTDKHVEMLWSNVDSDERDRSDAASNLLEDVTNGLPDQMLDTLYDKIQEHTMTTERHVELVRRFCSGALERSNSSSGRDYGLSMLWNLMIEPSASPNVAEAARRALSKLLVKPACRRRSVVVDEETKEIPEPSRRLDLYLDKCIGSVNTERACVPQCLRLALTILSHNSVSEKTQCERLIRDVNARQECVKELISFLGLANKSNTSWTEVCPKLTGHLTFEQAVNCRLSFLLSLVTDSKDGSFKYEELSNMWNAFCDHDNRETVERFLCWISSLNLTRDVTRDVFDKLLCSKSGERICARYEKGIKCAQIFLLKRSGLNKDDRLAVAPFEIQGMNPIWNIAMSENATEKVFLECESFIVRLHLHLDDKKVDRHAIWSSLIEKCMQCVSSNDKKSARTLRLLGTFDRELHKPLPPKTGGGCVDGFPHGKLNNDRVISLMIEPMNFGKDRGGIGSGKKFVYYTLPLSETVAHLRDRVALDLSTDPKCLVMKKYEYQGGIELTVKDHDHKTFRDLRSQFGHSFQYVDVYRKEKPTADLSEHVTAYDVSVSKTEKDRDFARQVLAEKRYFDLLFRLLSSSNNSLTERAWDILSRLPTDSRLMNDLVNISTTTKWNELMGSSTKDLKLLYSLEIVETILEKENAVWRAKFIRSGGYKHLVGLLTSCDLKNHFETRLGIATVDLLLRAVCFFTSDDDEDSSSSNDDVNFKIVLHKLFGILEAVSKGRRSTVKMEPRYVAVPDKKKKKSNDLEEKEDDDNEDGGTKKKKANDRASVVQSTIASIVACVSRDASLLSTLYGFEKIGPAIMFALLHAPEKRVRQEVRSGLSKMCSRVGGGKFFRDILLSSLQDVNLVPTQCDDYFNLLTELFYREECTLEDLAREEKRLRDLIVSHPRVETTHEERDLVLQGLLKTLTVVITKSLLLYKKYNKNNDTDEEVDRSFLNLIFKDHLFEIPSSSSNEDVPPPKCKHPTSRSIAFDLIVSLARRNSSNWTYICSLCLSQHGPVVSVTDAFLSSSSSAAGSGVSYDSIMINSTMDVETKSSTGYVGLRNLGCICYMNAALQQLFMIPNFRRLLLSSRGDRNNDTSSPLHQVQRLFAFLQESEEMYYNPSGLCKSLKDYDGNSINVSVQDDASMFLTKLFQELDNALSTSNDRPTHRCIRGVVGMRKIAKSVKFPGKTLLEDSVDDPFYFLSLEVRGMKNLHESLDAFFEGNKFDGLRWYEKTPEEEKLETRRVPYIKKLPPHLILHLKRFEQDWSAGFLQLKKISDRMEFPFDLDLKKYSKPVGGDVKGSKKEEEKEDSYYKYRLAGILVHRGVFSSGHYYSYIRTRGSSGKDGVWNEFNDRSVTPMNPGDIPEKTFGQAAKRDGGYGNSYAPTAFVLFYDRVSEVKEEQNSIRKLQEIHRGAVPPLIAKEIDRRNTEMYRNRHIQNREYVNFLAKLLESETGNSMSVQLCTRFLVGTLIPSQVFSDDVPKWLKRLGKLLSSERKGVKSAEWLLRLLVGQDVLENALSRNSTNDTLRECLSELLAEALRCVALRGEGKYDDDNDGNDDMKLEEKEEKEDDVENLPVATIVESSTTSDVPELIMPPLPSPPSSPSTTEMSDDLKGRKLVAAVLRRLLKLRIDHSDYGSCINDCYRLVRVVAEIGNKEKMFLSKKVNILRVVCNRFRIACRRYFSVNGHELDILLELMAVFLPLSEKKERENLFLSQSKDDATGSLVVTTLIASASLNSKRNVFMTSLYRNVIGQSVENFEILLSNLTATITSTSTYHDNIKLLFKGYRYSSNAMKGHEDLVLRYVNIALKKNRFYYRCMESLTEYVLRMVRRDPSMRAKMVEEDWKWLLEWWSENRERPTMYQDTAAGVSLLKPGHPSSYGNHYSSSWDYRDREDFRDAEDLRQRLERALKDENEDEDAWDSDDAGIDIIGRHICVDNKSVWKIIEFDESRGKHFLREVSSTGSSARDQRRERWEKIGVGVVKRWKFCDRDMGKASTSSAAGNGGNSSSNDEAADDDEKHVDVSII